MSQKAGEILTKSRENKGWTQADAAGKLGISTKQYGKYEQGKFPKFKREQVETLEAIFGIKIMELIYEQNVPHGNGDSWNLVEDGADYNNKTPDDVPGLMKALIESQKAEIRLLKERQQAETRLIQVEATLKIVVGILNGLKIQEQSRTPSAVSGDVEEVAVQLKGAGKNENSGRGAASKSGKS